MEVVKEKRKPDIGPISDLKFRGKDFLSDRGNPKRSDTSRFSSGKYRVLPEICCNNSKEADKSSKSVGVIKSSRKIGNENHKIQEDTSEIKPEDYAKFRMTANGGKVEQREVSNKTGVTGVRAGGRKVSLALKLPDGSRVVSNFLISDPLKCLLKAAESGASRSFRGCKLMCHENQKVYTDLNQSIEVSGIEDRSTLYLQLPRAQ